MGSLSDYEWAAKVNECITSRVVGELPMAPADLNARALAECRASDTNPLVSQFRQEWVDGVNGCVLGCPFRRPADLRRVGLI